MYKILSSRIAAQDGKALTSQKYVDQGILVFRNIAEYKVCPLEFRADTLVIIKNYNEADEAALTGTSKIANYNIEVYDDASWQNLTNLKELTVDLSGYSTTDHNHTAAQVKFTDDKTFQQKLDEGSLNGPAGKSAFQTYADAGGTLTETQFNTALTTYTNKLDKTTGAQVLPAHVGSAYDIASQIGIETAVVETALGTTGNTFIDLLAAASKNTIIKVLKAIISNTMPSKLTTNKAWVGDGVNRAQEVDVYDEFVDTQPVNVSQRRVKTLEMEINHDGASIVYAPLVKKIIVNYIKADKTTVLFPNINGFRITGIDMVCTNTASTIFTSSPNTFTLMAGATTIDKISERGFVAGKVYSLAVPDSVYYVDANLSVVFVAGDYAPLNITMTYCITGYQL